MRTLSQIVPTLPPAIDGLGDYALNLARQLRQDCAIETHFVMGNPRWLGGDEIHGFSCSSVTRRSARSLLSVLSKDSPLLLHYSGYGYALRGYPRWLVAGLERWRTNNTQPLVTMFHEVYPYEFGPPWTSSFWLSPLQKQLATRLVRLSDRCLTSRQQYAKLLHQLGPGQHEEIPVLPVFSSIGEPHQLLPLEQRDRIAIAFGHRNMRSPLYQRFLPQIEQTCQVLNIQAIYDIGVPTGLKLSPIHNLPIVEMGILPAWEVSQLMSGAIAGFLSFPPPEYLGKSTIFAAYCAHGLLPILTQSSCVPVEGLEAGKHYWAFGDKIGMLSWDAGCAIATNARAWYDNHCLARQAQIFAKTLLT
jgi:hypothetical protein